MRTVARPVLEIVPLAIIDDPLLSALATEATRVFSLPSRVGAPEHLPATALDTGRGQYHATRLLEHLAASDRPAYRLLGVTAVDIFTPIMRHVFGEAMLPGRAALVSTYRLGVSPSTHLRLRDRPVFIGRVVKEGIHELGHSFGLTHCDDPACVMAASLAMAQIDAKSTGLCRYCRVMLADEFERLAISP
jgi:archaemetzincin